MELLPIPLHPYRRTCTTVLTFWSPVFYCLFPGLPAVCYIWIEVPFSHWAPVTKAVVRSSGRGTHWKDSLVEVYQLELHESLICRLCVWDQLDLDSENTAGAVLGINKQSCNVNNGERRSEEQEELESAWEQDHPEGLTCKVMLV